MRGATFGFGALAAMTTAIGAALWLQRETNAQLCVERDRLRASESQVAALHDERARLEAEKMPAGELERLRADHVALVRLRGELDSLKAAAEAARKPEAPAPVTQTAVMSRRITAGEWKNAGRATPMAAFETMLSAAGTGDVDLLRTTLSLSAAVRTKVAAVLAGLPEAMRSQYTSPETFIAAFAARDVSFGEVLVQREISRGSDDVSLDVVLFGEKPWPGTNNRARQSTLAVHREDGGWKLVVPESAVEKYGAMLKGAEPSTGGGK